MEETLLSQPLWDTHMHSQFSGDSDTPQEEMIHSAIEKGLAGICFTDHLDIDYPKEPDLFLLDLANYHASVMAYQETYQDKLPIRFGVELGLQPHLAGLHSDILSQYPFDFVIGSSHVVHGFDPYYPDFYEGRDEKTAYLEYFESILENITAFDGFDVYGHIDYVVRYGPTTNQNYHWEDYKDVIDEILRQLISRGKGIEINTGGFKYGLGHPNPTEEIIRRYRELGGEIITLGADAHKPEHVAFDFAKVPSILKEAGFTYYTVFEKRKPNFIKIE
ncbi:MAG: histidinol-phosphatase HisJ family protein [Roseburia sp.]|uniref:histidinol-phosphatase HisJ family protein n=1 Tax=Roseburia sp. 831b TaxID=1261635 RepID=UPI0009523228|nr:histidinol-phosphatase HisJ family protein [Roseburia sp. 831b]MCI5919474.1 histidinol-phosphatase HisJ family protein [Roseburia sp.]MDD6216273.1 histidinol-phosphatase HisJ family protein [Roseburia sp.]MDY5883021.1 histidinol-phosphatase HisJ family protein [Roseburia sp.]WVK73542.1 histidinol-phosphatase HisJ family protein [Roseburia sp. 831b]